MDLDQFDLTDYLILLNLILDFHFTDLSNVPTKRKGLLLEFYQFIFML